jgi:hypothetical protein
LHKLTDFLLPLSYFDLSLGYSQPKYVLTNKPFNLESIWEIQMKTHKQGFGTWQRLCHGRQQAAAILTRNSYSLPPPGSWILIEILEGVCPQLISVPSHKNQSAPHPACIPEAGRAALLRASPGLSLNPASFLRGSAGVRLAILLWFSQVGVGTGA